MADTTPKAFFTKRLLLSLIFTGTTTAALFTGKMADHVYIYGLAVILAGHHAADIIKAYRSGGA